jgi:hypothetical protein
MTAIDTDRHRRRAAALARVLEPLIASHLAMSEERRTPAPRPQTLDRHLRAAAEKVAAAADQLLQAKFSPAEIPARRALEQAAMSLRTTLRREKRP